MTRAMPQTGDVYRHFKGSYYYVFGNGRDCETNEKVVAYIQAADTLEQLKEERAMLKMFPPAMEEADITTLDEFLAEVDRNKYPNVKQKFRFEKVEF